MRKKLFTFLLALAASVGMMWAQGPWNSGDCTLTLSNGVMTVSGSGAMGDNTGTPAWGSASSTTTSIVIGDGVTYVGAKSFGEYYYTETLTLGNSVERIGNYAFSMCIGLTAVEFPSTLQTIGASAFNYCQGLTSLSFPAGLLGINDYAFSSCTGLTSVTCAATTPPTLGTNVFNNVNTANIPLYVPAGSVEAYQAAAQWNAFDIQGYNPTPTPSETAARFVYNYDCQRNPAYPQAGSPCNLSGFSDPLVGYTGIGIRNKALGPWKLEYVGNYTPSNHYGCEYRVISAVNSYYPTLSDDEKQAKCLEVPIFRLWQYNLAAKEYQHASYGIICAYAAEANAQDHGALFISSESWGCFLTGHQHTSSFQISCENDLTTGMADLVAAASINDPDLDAVLPIIVSIDAIGDVELTQFCKDQIEGSRAAYDALSDTYKAQITNYSTLTDAEAEWADLVAAAQPYADVVIALINAIPDPVVYTQECKDAIDAAQAAYDALTDGQKILVTNAETLLQAPIAFINAAPSVNIVFEADNSNIKKVEDVTLPRAFATGDASSEMVSILKELYNLDEEYTMGYAYSYSDAVVISNSWSNKSWTVSPFAGTATVTGNLSKVESWGMQSFTVYISLELPPFGPAPAPTDEQVPTNADPENPGVYYYSTFFHSTQNYALTNDGTTAFVADLSGNNLILTEIAHGEQVIPKGTAVILRKNGSADPVVLAPTSEPGVSFSAHNSLEGVDDETAVTSIDGLTRANCYVLSGQQGVGFYRINSDNLKAHKAYVKYVSNPSGAPKRMRFVFNTTTGVEAVTGYGLQVTGQKLIENGQLIIIKNDVRYNAQGQIVK